MKKTFVSFLSLLLVFLLGALSPALASEKNHTNFIGMEFVLIPAGAFNMGTDIRSKSEGPVHRVNISKSFYLGKYEVTQDQWMAVMGENPSKFQGKSHPVEMVSWEEVQTFIQRLNGKERTGRYRLPTEAEWEYAARAGSTGNYYFGNAEEQLGHYAWYSKNAGEMTHPVGQKQPSTWGLYDMYGNVGEWVQDWFGKDYYSNSSSTDPAGPASGDYFVFVTEDPTSITIPKTTRRTLVQRKVVRGGSWKTPGVFCESVSRGPYLPDHQYPDVGFRLVFSPFAVSPSSPGPQKTTMNINR